MANNRSIVDILMRAEGELAEHIARVAEKGDYGAVDIARYVAIGIRDIRFKIAASKQPVPASAPSGKQEAGAAPDRAAYPRFELRKEGLVRVGWSKKHRQEFEHVVPRRAFETTIRAMKALLGRGHGPFPVEQIVQEVARLDASIERRPIFLTLGMLQEQGAIKQNQFGAYHLPANLGRAAMKAFGRAG